MYTRVGVYERTISPTACLYGAGPGWKILVVVVLVVSCPRHVKMNSNISKMFEKY